MASDKKVSNTYWNRIQYISLILAIFVISRHNSSFSNYESTFFLSFYDILKYSVTEIAVPMFFLISGFNYYRDYTTSKWVGKIKNRVKSLLVPYLLWNVIYCIFCLVTSNTRISEYFIGREKYDFTVENVILGCLYHWRCNSHFWFVFNLMLFAVLNICMYYVIKNKLLAMLFLGMTFIGIYVFNISIPLAFIYRTDSVLYYYIGAYIAIHNKKVIVSDTALTDSIFKFFGKKVESKKAKLIEGIIGLLLLSVTLLLLIPGMNKALRLPVILCGCVGLWILSGCLAKPKRKCVILTGGYIFLLYAVHGIIQPILVKMVYLVLPKTAYMSVVNFVIVISLTIAICAMMRVLTSRFIPRLDHVLTGWRR